jgi:vancomycin resistance protein VanJ
VETPGPRKSGDLLRSWWRRLLFWGVLVELVAVVLFIGALLFGERSRTTLILLYLPRLPLLVATGTGGLLSLLTRRRAWRLAGAHVVLALVVLFPVMGLAVGAPRSVEPPIRLASYNVFFGKGGRTALVEEVAAFPADVVILQAAFDSLGEKLRVRLPERTVRQDGEFLIVSKLPLQSVEVPEELSGGTAAMFVKYALDTPGGALRLYSVHPYSPRQALFGDRVTGNDIAQREAQIGAAVAAAKGGTGPFVVAGDTNLPALSAIGRRHFSGLTDAFADVGLGFGYTFPAKRPWMRIDRALGSEGIRFGEVRVGPRGASDHRPLFVEFALVPDSGR